MASTTPYSVSTARIFYNRPVFGAKLTSLITTVTSMQDELGQIIQAHSYLDVHHHHDDLNAMACLSEMQNMTRVLAESLGRTRVLPRTRHGAIRTDTILPRTVYTREGGDRGSDGESSEEDFRGFSWAHSEEFCVRRPSTPANMESRWSYSTDGSTVTDSSSEYEVVDDTSDEEDEEMSFPALEDQMVELEEPDFDYVVTFEIAHSCDLEVDNMLAPSDVHVAFDLEDAFARLGASNFEPRPEDEPLPVLRVPDAAEEIGKAPSIRRTVTRHITELFYKAKSKVKIVGKGVCTLCGPCPGGSVHKGRLSCEKCGMGLPAVSR